MAGKRRRTRRKTKRRNDGGRFGAMLFGLVLGLGLAAAAWWLLTPPEARPEVPSVTSAEKASAPKEPRAAAPVEIEPSGRGYDFYEMLPEQEVLIDDTASAPRTSRDTAAPQKALADPGLYMLQAGSFRNAEGAESIKAKLALQGIVARVRPVPSADGTLHQVRVGPVDQDTANDYLRRVREAGIEVSVFRAQR